MTLYDYEYGNERQVTIEANPSRALRLMWV